MSEAKKRNPAIFGYGLSWSFPAWIGQPLSDAQVNYTISWVQGAIQKYEFDVRYVGIWNEQKWSTDYVKRLRRGLDKAGLKEVGIVVADNAGWFDASLLKKDPEFAAAVAVAGTHYPRASTSSADLRELGNVTLWSAEDSSTYFDEAGGGCWARILNWNWVVGEMTATIIWNLVSSYLEGTHWYGDSLMDAAQPWSGHYEVKSPIWTSAHTTQFTEPGWMYLRNGTGSGFLPAGGSYVTLVSDKTAANFTIVIETMTKDHSLCIRANPAFSWTVADNQTVYFRLKAAPSGTELPSSLHLWASRLFGEKTYFFEQQEDIKVDENGSFMLTVFADSVYTLSTTSGQQKGQYPQPPGATKFPVPYSDNFDNYTVDTMPKYFTDQCGSFAAAPRRNTSLPGNGGGAFQQMVTEVPIGWHGGAQGDQSKQPLTVIGDWNATNYSVSFEACIIDTAKHNSTQSALDTNLVAAVNVGGPVGPKGGRAYESTWYNYGYFLLVAADGSWQLWAGSKILINGTLSPPGIGKWHTMTLAAELNDQGGTQVISGSWDGSNLFSVKDVTWTAGFAGLGSGWHHAQFDDFHLNRSPHPR